jgi:hypothetical protein
MGKYSVSIVKYEKPLESVRSAVDLCAGLDHLPPKARVIIKANMDKVKGKFTKNTRAIPNSRNLSFL